MVPMRIVVDTNILVSAYLTPKGKAAQILEQWRHHRFDLIISEPLLAEYERVLRYDHIQSLHLMSNDEISTVIDDFREFAFVVKPTQKISVIKDDPDDNKFLECVIAGSASYITSGDTHLLQIGQYKNIQILTTTLFLKNITT